MDIATLSCSVVSRINPLKKVLEDVRITFGVAAPVPYRCAKTEEALRGMEIGEELYQKVEELVVPDVRTTSGENMSSNGKIYPSSDAENVTGGEQS